MDHAAETELQATVAARRELGPEHDDHLIAGFLERIEGEIDRRVSELVATRSPRGRGSTLGRRELRAAIPLLAIAGIFGGPAGIFTGLLVLLIAFLVLTFARR